MGIRNTTPGDLAGTVEVHNANVPTRFVELDGVERDPPVFGPELF